MQETVRRTVFAEGTPCKKGRPLLAVCNNNASGLSPDKKAFISQTVCGNAPLHKNSPLNPIMNYRYMEAIMLKKILSPQSCAECRLCCVFDRYDIWETPVFTAETVERIKLSHPEAQFIRKDGGFISAVGELNDEQLFSCPALTPQGCMLGDDKPFDCRIWPYRIMTVGDRRAITLASICEEMFSRPLSQLVGLLRDGLADEIFRYADAHPEIVKPYYEGYPVLMFEK